MYDEAKNHVEINVKVEGKKKTEKVKLKTKECKEVSEAIMAKAEALKSAAKAAKKEKQELAKELVGDWKVVRKAGAPVSEFAELDSKEVGVVAYGQVVTVDKAEPNYGGSFKTRMRIVEQVLQMKDGTEQEMVGWITMKSEAGIDVVKKVGDADEDDGSDDDDDDDGDITSAGLEGAGPPEPVGNIDFDVVQLKGKPYNKKASNSLKLSVSGMGVLIFDGERPLDTIRFIEMKSWEFVPDSSTEEDVIVRRLASLLLWELAFIWAVDSRPGLPASRRIFADPPAPGGIARLHR